MIPTGHQFATSSKKATHQPQRMIPVAHSEELERGEMTGELQRTNLCARIVQAIAAHRQITASV